MSYVRQNNTIAVNQEHIRCLWFGRQTYISFFRVWVFQRWEQGHNPKGMELLCCFTNSSPAKMKTFVIRFISDLKKG